MMLSGVSECSPGAGPVDGLDLRALWIAVIFQAMEDALFRDEELPRCPGLRKQRGELRTWARAWLASRDEYENSFERICTQLDLSPVALRQALESGWARAMLADFWNSHTRPNRHG